MDKNFTISIASTIWSQLTATTEFPILGSWGIQKKMYFHHEKLDMSGLVLLVNGKLYQGHLFIAYNEGRDVYELYKLNGIETELIKEDIHFDELGTVIDKNVENPMGTFSYAG